MKKFYKLLTAFLFAVLCLYVMPARASHVMGTDIRWECLGQDSFKITVSGYRDCNGIPMSGGGIILKCPNATVNAGGTISEPKDITPICAEACTRCQDRNCADTRYGIHVYEITTVVKLDRTKCCKWKISWEQCCRNGALTTIPAENFYSEVEMDICTDPCNNSPYFTLPPVAIFCKDRCVYYNPGVNDKDMVNGQADSLVYKFGRPMSAEGSFISFFPGYDEDEPLKYLGAPDKDAEWEPNCSGFHLDSTTGELKFKPTKADVTVIVVVVEEWRKDANGVPKKIGEIRRDLQMIITDECNENKSPVIVSEKYTYTFCAGESRCITMNTFDLDKNDSVKLTWNNQIPGGTFIAEQNKKWPKGIFCWKPNNSDVRTFPYQFVTEARDNACPYPGIANRTFKIYVKPAPEAQRTIKLVGGCGEVSFQAISTGRVPIVEYVWTGEVPFGDAPIWFKGSKFNYTYSEGGTYRISLMVTSPDGCRTIYTDSVKIPTKVKIDVPNDSAVCYNSTIDIPSWRMYGNNPYTYRWMSGDSVRIDSGATATMLKSVRIDRDTAFLAEIWDGNGCWSWDTMKIRVNYPPVPKLGKDIRACKGDTVKLNASDSLDLKKEKYQWLANTKGTFTPVGTDSVLKITDSGIYVVKVVDSIGCFGSDTINVFFNPRMQIVKQQLKACKNQDMSISAGTFESDVKDIYFEWRDLTKGGEIVLKGYGASILNLKATRNRYTYEVCATQKVLGVTCVACGEVDILVKELPDVKIFSLPELCTDGKPTNLFGYTNLQVPKGKWECLEKPAAVDSASGFFFPKIADSGVWTLKYTYTDVDGCYNSATRKITVDNTPDINATPMEVCNDQTEFYLNTSIPSYVVNNSSKWEYVSGGDKNRLKDANTLNAYYDTKDAPPGLVTFKYTYIEPTSTKCQDTAMFRLTIHKVPVVSTGAVPAAMCVSDNNYPLAGAEPFGGKWTSNSFGAIQTSGTAAYFSPSAAGVGTHRLYYTAGDKCVRVDSTDIEVRPNPDPSIIVPGNVCISTAPFAIQHKVSSQFTISNIVYSGKGVVDNSTFNPAIAGQGTHTITGTFFATNGCATKVTATVKVDPRPTVNITTNADLCEGSDYFIEAEATTNLSWGYDTNLVTSNPVHFVTGDGKKIRYTPSLAQISQGFFTLVAITEPIGECPSERQERVFNIRPRPKANFTANKNTGCNPLIVIFKSTTPKIDGRTPSLLWTFGDGGQAVGEVVSHTFKEKGKYFVQLVATHNGCSDTIRINDYITVHQTPTADFIAQPTYTSIQLPKIDFKSDGYSRNLENPKYLWNFGDSLSSPFDTSTAANPTYNYKDTGTYTIKLMIVNDNGCKDTIVKENYIYIKPRLTVFIPNVFTPNQLYNDKTKVNEVFRVIAASVTTFNMKVYNRWGELMYEGTDPDSGWDGFYKSNPAQEGVYMYVVKVQDLVGKEYKYTGTVTLLR